MKTILIWDYIIRNDWKIKVNTLKKLSILSKIQVWDRILTDDELEYLKNN